MTLRFEPQELRWEPQGNGVRARLGAEPGWGRPGSPDIPAVPLTVLPPPGMRLADVQVVDQQTVALVAPAVVTRFQEPTETLSLSGHAAMQTVLQGQGGWMRGTRVDGVTVFPLSGGGTRWNLSTLITLEFHFEPAEGMPPVRPLRGQGPDIYSLPGRVVDFRENPSSLIAEPRSSAKCASSEFSPKFRPSLDGSPVSMVIITAEEYADEFQVLADWRTQTGTPAVVRTLEWITGAYSGGVDKAEKVRLFLRDAVRYWGCEYALLGGDAEIFPLRYGTTTYFGGANIPTDLYFACLDGSWNADGDHLWGEAAPPHSSDDADLLPELYVGRLPFRNEDQAQSMVSKTMRYEQGVAHDAEYPANALLLGEVLFPLEYPNADSIFLDGADLAESVAFKMSPHLQVDRLYENWQPFPDAVLEDLPDVIAGMNSGYGFVHHVGHGSYTGMSMGFKNKTLKRSDVDGLVNGDKTFILYSVNCTSAALDFDSIGKRFLQNTAGGAVALVGSTEFEFPITGNLFHQDYYRSMFEGDVTRPSVAMALAKVRHIVDPPLDSRRRWTQFSINYLGDPALQAWTRSPIEVQVNHQAGIQISEGLTVTVLEQDGSAPLEGVQVSIFGENNLLGVRPSDSSGKASFESETLQPGELTVTVYGPRLVPYQGTVVVQGDAPTLTVSPAVIQNENNFCLESGETAEAVFRLRNTGTVAATGLSITLETNAPEVSGVKQPSQIPHTLAAGDSVDLLVEITAADDARDLSVASMSVLVQADQGSWSLGTHVRVSSPELTIYETSLSELSGDGDTIPEAGERALIVVSVRNVGSGLARSVTATLESTGGDGTTVEVGTAEYGDVAGGGIQNPSHGFEVELDTNFPEFRLTFVHSLREDHAVETVFSELDIRAPDPPGVVSTQATATTILLSWEPSTASDLRQYIVYRAVEESGPYTRINGIADHAQTVFEDSGLGEFSAFYYRLAAQDRSGNVSEPTSPLRAVTGLAQLDGFPIPNGQETITSAAVADLDGDGVVEIISGGDEVYVMHADGTEYLDGDRDLRTVGVFSNVSTLLGFWAPPAVGDLDGDGRLEVVAVSFSEGLMYVWDSAGRVRKGWPQSTGNPDGSWVYGAPTLLDVTGDGNLEVLTHSESALYAFDADGRELRDGDNDPSTHGVFFKTNSKFSYASPAGQDIDNDGRAEVVVATRRGDVYVLDDTGTPFPGFPVSYNHDITSSPALADLTGDGQPEILFAVRDSLIFEVIQLDGSPLEGWGMPVLVNQDYDSSPAVADIDNDGDLEVAFMSGKSELFLWHHDGTRVAGFPVKFLDTTGAEMSSRGSPAIANLDDDDELEIVVTNNVGWIFGVNHDGTPVVGFPVRLNGGIEGGVCVRDVDEDGLNELVVVGLDANINVFNTAGHVTSDPGWPMFQRNSLRSGNRVSEIEPSRTPVLSAGVLQSPQLPGFADVFVVSTRELKNPPQTDVNGNVLPVTVQTPGVFYRAQLELNPGDYTLSSSGVSVDGHPGSVIREFSVLAPSSSGVWTSGQGVAVSASEPGQLLLVQEITGPVLAEQARRVEGRVWSVGPDGHPVPFGTKLRLPTDGSLGGVEYRQDGEWKPVPGIVGQGYVEVEPSAWGWFRLSESPAAILPEGLRFLSAGPNPFSAGMEMVLAVAASASVQVSVFDVQGRQVRRIHQGVLAPGEHTFRWDGRDDFGRKAGTGVYFVRIKDASSSVVRKLIKIQGGN